MKPSPPAPPLLLTLLFWVAATLTLPFSYGQAAAPAPAPTSPASAADDADDQEILEMLRAQVSAGIVLSNASERLNLGTGNLQAASNNQFSKANLYLSLELLPDLFHEQKKKLTKGKVGWFVDPLINVRMTSVGVDVNLTPTADGKTFDSSGFVSAQKAAVIQLGAVSGFSFNQSDKFQWGLGHIYREFIQSITDSQKASRFWDPDDDLYTATTHGVRLSLNRKDSAKHWRPVFYIDVSSGKFENHETPVGATDPGKACLAKTSACKVFNPNGALETVAGDFTYRREHRTYIESRLYLKGFHFGFEVNNGSGIDDMRFLFGGTFDFTKLFKTP